MTPVVEGSRWEDLFPKDYPTCRHGVPMDVHCLDCEALQPYGNDGGFYDAADAALEKLSPPDDDLRICRNTRILVATQKSTNARYETLRAILDEAYDYASRGKGEQRHGAGGKPWDQQRHVKIAEAVGMGFAVGQAMKKLEEGYGMEDWDACRREFLGAITYIASAILAGDNGIHRGRANDVSEETT